MRAALAAALLAIGAAPGLDADTLLERAQRYLAEWQQALAAIVAEERYTQTMTRRELAVTGGRPRTALSLPITSQRQLVSDVMLLLAPAGDVWLSFRDVAMLDGTPVRDRQRRFDELFINPDGRLLANARRIADESARFNLGHVYRNINTPTAALVFVQEPFASGSRWHREKDEDLDGTRACVLRFQQVRAPFAIRRQDGRGQPASGHVWLEPDSGRILQIEFTIRDPALRASVLTRYGKVPGIDPWVPLRMEDSYQIGMEKMRGEAVYTNHRAFQTSARVVER